MVSEDGSRSPDIHGTPARSVLDEFAELAAMSEKTPVRLGRAASRKRKASKSPESAPQPKAPAKGKGRAAPSRQRRATTPDGLHGLLAAAAHVEGSPMAPTTASASKRRRTVNGQDLPKPALSPERKPAVVNTGDALGLSTAVEEPTGGSEDDSASAAIPLALAAIGVDPVGAGMQAPKAGPSSVAGSVASHISSVSRAVEGQQPVPLTKPPHPYHEMIRHAIESAPGQKLQLAQIYKSIAERFPFFKMLDEQKTAGWQNSIRHNLSLK